MPSSLPSIINVRNSAVLLRISKFFVTIQGINNCRKHKVTENTTKKFRMFTNLLRHNV